MSSRGVVVNFTFTVDELSGVPLPDGTRMKARWQRGQSVGESQWAVLQGGVVQWRAQCNIPRVMIPAGDDSQKKFMHITFFCDRQEPPVSSVKVPLQFHNERKRKASLQFHLNKSEAHVKLQLTLTMQMRMIGDSVGSDAGYTSQSSITQTGFSQANSASILSSPTISTRAHSQLGAMTPTSRFEAAEEPSWNRNPDNMAGGGLQRSASQSSMHGSVQGFQNSNSAGANEQMRSNLYKLAAKLQESEARNSARKRECQELKSHNNNLKGEIENLKMDYDSAEMRCLRLQQDLQREQAIANDLHHIKAQIQQFEREGYGDPNARGCDAGCVIA